jgi:rhamnose utilization protein RhaD (predicted bifunctional aldolase and dehydrogenase)
MHPCELSRLLCNNDIENALVDKCCDFAFDHNNYLVISYMNPGKELSQEIHKKYNNHSVIFLMNHGVIFTSDSLIELHELILHILKPCTSIFELQDITNNHIIWKSKTDKSFYVGALNIYIPDIAIYLGYEIVNGTQNDINMYISKYNRYPVLIKYKMYIYIIAETKKKYYDIEEMLETYSIFDKYGMTTIDTSNVNMLMNWDREKYRQTV